MGINDYFDFWRKVLMSKSVNYSLSLFIRFSEIRPDEAWWIKVTVFRFLRRIPEHHFVHQMSSQSTGSPNLVQGSVSHDFTACLSDFYLSEMTLSSKVHRPDNSLKLSFFNIWDLCSNLVVCESFLKSDLSDIFLLYVRKTWNTWLILAISQWGSSFDLKGFFYSYAWFFSGCP